MQNSRRKALSRSACPPFSTRCCLETNPVEFPLSISRRPCMKPVISRRIVVAFLLAVLLGASKLWLGLTTAQEKTDEAVRSAPPGDLAPRAGARSQYFRDGTTTGAIIGQQNRLSATQAEHEALAEQESE